MNTISYYVKFRKFTIVKCITIFQNCHSRFSLNRFWKLIKIYFSCSKFDRVCLIFIFLEYLTFGNRIKIIFLSMILITNFFSVLSLKKKTCCFSSLVNFLTLRFISRYTTISFDPVEIRRLRLKEFHTLFMRVRALLYANFLNYSRRCDCAIFPRLPETLHGVSRDILNESWSEYNPSNFVSLFQLFLTMLIRRDALLYNTSDPTLFRHLKIKSKNVQLSSPDFISTKNILNFLAKYLITVNL